MNGIELHWTLLEGKFIHDNLFFHTHLSQYYQSCFTTYSKVLSATVHEYVYWYGIQTTSIKNNITSITLWKYLCDCECILLHNSIMTTLAENWKLYSKIRKYNGVE